MIVRPSEIITILEFAEEQIAPLKLKYADLIELWNSNVQDNKALAKALETSPSGAASMVRCCQSHGLIQ